MPKMNDPVYGSKIIIVRTSHNADYVEINRPIKRK